MPNFSSCLSSPQRSEPQRDRAEDLQAKALLDPAGYRPKCPFCDVSREKGFDVVKETDEMIAFRDRSPQAETHLLIIPRKHLVSTVKELRTEHVPFLQRMNDLAIELVPSVRKTGFHIPPFSSVHHLHLHVLAGKPTLLGRFKYPDRERRNGKGWSWFVTLTQAIKILENGGRMGLGAT